MTVLSGRLVSPGCCCFSSTAHTPRTLEMEKTQKDRSGQSWDLFVPIPERAIDIRGFLQSNSVALTTPGSPYSTSPFRQRNDFINDGTLALNAYSSVNDPHLAGFRALRKMRGKVRVGMIPKYPPLSLSKPYLIPKKGLRKGMYLRLPSCDRRADKKKMRRKMFRSNQVLLPPVGDKALAQTMLTGLLLKVSDPETPGEDHPVSDDTPEPGPELEFAELAEPAEPERRETSQNDITNKMASLPIPIFAIVLSYMDTSTMLGTVIFGSISTCNKDPASRSSCLKKVKEITSSLFMSKTFEAHWQNTVRTHRIDRRRALDEGDMDVDVEGSNYALELGEIDQDIPVWKKEMDEEDELRIEKSDFELCERHLEMIKAIFDFTVEENVDVLPKIDYAAFAGGIYGPSPDEDEGSGNGDGEVRHSEILSPRAAEERRLLNVALTESLITSTVSSCISVGLERVLRGGTALLPSPSSSFQLPPLACFELFGAKFALNFVASAISSLPIYKRSKIINLNLDGCKSLEEAEFVALIESLPNLKNLRLNGLACVGDDACRAIGSARRLRYLGK